MSSSFLEFLFHASVKRNMVKHETISNNFNNKDKKNSTQPHHIIPCELTTKLLACKLT